MGVQGLSCPLGARPELTSGARCSLHTSSSLGFPRNSGLG